MTVKEFINLVKDIWILSIAIVVGCIPFCILIYIVKSFILIYICKAMYIGAMWLK